MKINEKYKGIFYIILAAFGFAFMNLFVKLAGDLPAIEKSFFRNLVAVFFAFVVMKKEHIAFSIPKGSGKYIFFRSQRQRQVYLLSFPFWNHRYFCKLLCDRETLYCRCIHAQ